MNNKLWIIIIINNNLLLLLLLLLLINNRKRIRKAEHAGLRARDPTTPTTALRQQTIVKNDEKAKREKKEQEQRKNTREIQEAYALRARHPSHGEAAQAGSPGGRRRRTPEYKVI